jgi:hypothetical protein
MGSIDNGTSIITLRKVLKYTTHRIVLNWSKYLIFLAKFFQQGAWLLHLLLIPTRRDHYVPLGGSPTLLGHKNIDGSSDGHHH